MLVYGTTKKQRKYRPENGHKLYKILMLIQALKMCTISQQSMQLFLKLHHQPEALKKAQYNILSSANGVITYQPLRSRLFYVPDCGSNYFDNPYG